jgi:hypothetical protein
MSTLSIVISLYLADYPAPRARARTVPPHSHYVLGKRLRTGKLSGKSTDFGIWQHSGLGVLGRAGFDPA